MRAVHAVKEEHRELFTHKLHSMSKTAEHTVDQSNRRFLVSSDKQADSFGPSDEMLASDESNESGAFDTDSNASSSSSRKAEAVSRGGKPRNRSAANSSAAGASRRLSPNNSSVSGSQSGACEDRERRRQSAKMADDCDGDEPSVKRKRRPRPPTGLRQQCAVCGDDAYGYNFDAVSCESCKAFFRRNAMRQHVCQNGNQCKIDKDSRKYCSSCRLTKCLEVGMKRELILTPDKLEKRAKLVRKKHVREQSGGSASASQPAAIGTQHLSTFAAGREQASLHVDSSLKITSSISAASSPSSCPPTASAAAASEVILAKQERFDDSPCSSAFAAGLVGSSSFLKPSLYAGARQTEHLGNVGSASGLGIASSMMAMGHSELGRMGQHQPEVMLAEMARLGLDYAMASASQSRQNGPVNVSPIVKTEPVDSTSLFNNSNRASNSEQTTVSSASLPAVDFDETLRRCKLACEQLLKPLNANDMRQLRPATDASQQFNYGEVFVRRFVNAFKQITDFRSAGQVAQLKLLRSTMISTLNIGGVFSFDASRQAWVLQTEGCPETVYFVNDMISLFELSGQGHIRDYMQSYCDFHARLRNEFGSDVVLYLVLILIDMFSPHRFTADREMLAWLVPSHARYVQFLELYLVSNYGSRPGSNSLLKQSGTDSAQSSDSSLEPVVKRKLDFCLDMLSNARTLEEYLAITSQYIGLTAMLPLLAEVCETLLRDGSDTE